MKRRALLAVLVTCVAAEIAAAYEAPVFVEVRRAGPYQLQIAFYDASPTVSRPVRLSVRTRRDGVSSHVSSILVRGIPGPETDAVTTRPVILRRDPLDKDAHTGMVLLSVRGAWELEITVTGPVGAGATRVPVAVTATYAIPEWVGWIVGLSPLFGLALFAQWQRRYLAQLLAEETLRAG